jgi:hypothetical protein
VDALLEIWSTGWRLGVALAALAALVALVYAVLCLEEKYYHRRCCRCHVPLNPKTVGFCRFTLRDTATGRVLVDVHTCPGCLDEVVAEQVTKLKL